MHNCTGKTINLFYYAGIFFIEVVISVKVNDSNYLQLFFYLYY